MFTNIFSRSTRVIPDSLQNKPRVSDDLPDELKNDCQHEPENPVVKVVCTPEQMKEKAEDQQAEAIGVKHVLGGLWCVPLLYIERPPCSFMPGHCEFYAVN